MSHLSAPVVFIIFNRPDTTQKVFEKIREARPRKLFVIADGPRSGKANDAEKCKAARAIVDQVDWECEVIRNFSEANMGCRRRVSSGLTWVFNQVDRAIILEDDCVPHVDFFAFCDAMLERYKEDARIGMISGLNYRLNELDVHSDSYFYSRFFAIWGWATWSRSWKKYNDQLVDWPDLRKREVLNQYYSQLGIRDFLERLFDSAHNNTSDAWGPRWFYACLWNHELTIVPKVNMISNIGVEGTHTEGVDVTINTFFPTFGLSQPLKHPAFVYPLPEYDEVIFRRKFRLNWKQVLKIWIKKRFQFS